MLETVVVGPRTPLDEVGDVMLSAWAKSKVLHLQGPDPSKDLRGFYDRLVTNIGQPVPLAEDARIESREAQRTGELWMEVRYDPSIPNAYRHSSGPQPLHTD